MTSSRIPGFHNLDRAQRFQKIREISGLNDIEANAFLDASVCQGDLASVMSENVIGTLNIPLGIATNLIVDGEDVLVPMATEESSVIAAVCNGARQCRESGGVTTSADEPRMIAQIQIAELDDPSETCSILSSRHEDIRELCDSSDPLLVELGGGFRKIDTRIIEDQVILHLIVDVRDAMGANAVNSMAEKLAPYIEQWTGGRVGLKILSNLADQRLVRAKAEFSAKAIGGAEVVGAMVNAWAFANADPYRAATHNKGIMNGVSAVVLATGNDTRAVESGAHAFAASGGGYAPLTSWQELASGNLVGEIEVPVPVGIVGGATKTHPTAQMCLKIMNIKSADRLSRIIAAVGLIQNFSAMKALATEGIQRGHMGLHARNIAIAAGAEEDKIDEVAAEMVGLGEIREDVARRIFGKSS